LAKITATLTIIMTFNFLDDIDYFSGNIRVAFVLVLICLIVNLVAPQSVAANTEVIDHTKNVRFALESKPSQVDLLTQRFEKFKDQPVNIAKLHKVLRTVTVIATAYSSDVYQTDSTPCITANGFNVCKHGKEDVLAANFLKFGTKVRIPELYGNKIFTIQDRMNKRYTHRVDLWKTSRDRAITFGKRLIKIEIVE